MGASAPKSETVVKGGKPTVVREWLSPEYLKQLSGLASYYGNRALQERSTYQNMVNAERAGRGKVALYPTMTNTLGETIAPGTVSTPFDTSSLVTAAQQSGMFKPPRSGTKPKPTDSRAAYANAINDVKSNELYGYDKPLPRMTGGG
jgi:hypothetical protein